MEISHQKAEMKLFICTALFFGTSLIGSVQAADWDIVTGVSVGQTITDNANLDEEERFESITRISPRISIYGEGARANVDLSYAPEYRHYWHETEDDELAHFLRAEGDVELVKNHFFIDGWATADQHTITSRGRTGIDGVTGSEDLTNVYTAGISPYYTTRLGRTMAFEARYGIDRVYYSAVDDDVEDADNSTAQRADLVLGSGPSVKAIPWEIRLEHSNVNYDDLDDDDKIQRVQGDMAYQLNNTWALAATLGYEDYELAVNEDFDGQIWGVGFIFTPSVRTRLAAGAGERAFGDSYYLDFVHRSRQTVWTAGYSRDFTSARDEITRPRLFERRDVFDNLVRDPVLAEPVRSARTGATLDEGYYELHRFDTRFTLSTPRTSVTLGADYAEREYAESSLGTEPDNSDLNLRALLNRQIRPRTTGFFNLTWTDYNEDEPAGAEDADYQQWIAALGGSYQLGPNSSLGMRVAHLDRDASTDEDSYEENQASIVFDMTW